MQYWINFKGVQSGPVDLDGMKQMGLTSAAYVWHEGLADWVKIKKKNINCKEYSESHSSDEQKDCNSDNHLNCNWE